MYYYLSSFLCISVFINFTHHVAFLCHSGKYKDFVPSIYPFNKPEEGWCWPAEILQQRLCSRCLDQPLQQYIFYKENGRLQIAIKCETHKKTKTQETRAESSNNKANTCIIDLGQRKSVAPGPCCSEPD